MPAVRHAVAEDHARIDAVIDAWWGGRAMRRMLPRLFFEHFGDTSFVVEEDGGIVAFLVGFVSSAQPGEAYIHFVGVRPDLHGVAIHTAHDGMDGDRAVFRRGLP